MDSLIREFFDEFFRRKKRCCLREGELNRGKLVAIDQRVANTGFSSDWNTSSFQRSNIAVNGSNADLELIRNLLSRDYGA